jgi:hypothetical protein
MTAVQIIGWIARVAGIGAFLLGLFFWITHTSVISIHMLFGLTLALSLLALGIIIVCTRGMRLLGVAGIGYALLLPAFGLTQAYMLIGSMHWLIQTAHLLVGAGAVLLVQRISARYKRLRLAVTAEASSPQAVR